MFGDRLQLIAHRIYRAFQISLIPPSGRDTTLTMAGVLKRPRRYQAQMKHLKVFFFEGPYNIFGQIDNGKLNLG